MAHVHMGHGGGSCLLEGYRGTSCKRSFGNLLCLVA